MRMLIVESVENMRRVRTIIDLHSKTENADIGTSDERAELLRAAVVLLHASIEEVVRNLFVEFLPAGSTQVLNELSYSEYTDRSKGVLLGDLLSGHKGRFVENVILDAINAHVDKLNINNAEQLIAQLRKVNIDTNKISKHLPNLDKIMKRRHQIVHQMDRDDALDPNSRSISPIDAKTVELWLTSTIEFNREIARQVDGFGT